MPKKGKKKKVVIIPVYQPEEDGPRLDLNRLVEKSGLPISIIAQATKELLKEEVIDPESNYIDISGVALFMGQETVSIEGLAIHFAELIIERGKEIAGE